jgi:tungstate transport system substrate-binding protein
MRDRLVAFGWIPTLAAWLGTVAPAGAAAQAATGDVILAPTTSTQDTGLLDSLTPRFEQRCRCRLKTIAVGTGQSLALAARGEADVVLVHAPALERKYLAEGAFIHRRLVMTNDFVLVGPPDDPAGVRGADGISDAIRRVGASSASFASRADSSGTHIMELNLWREAGGAPAKARYLEVGQGMGATLRVASQKRAYTLADRGTFLAQQMTLDLALVFEGGPELLNIYHVMLPNPDIHPSVNAAGGRAFADFIVAPEAQAVISRFGVARFGQPLFRPAAGRREAELRRISGEVAGTLLEVPVPVTGAVPIPGERVAISAREVLEMDGDVSPTD